MLSSSQQSVEPMQSSCSSPIMLIIALTENTCAQLEKIISLNMAMSTASVQESHRAFQKLLATTSPQEFLSIAIGQLESNMHSIRNYSCNLLELAEKTEMKLEQSGAQTLALQAGVATKLAAETEVRSVEKLAPAIEAAKYMAKLPTVSAVLEPMPPVKLALETQTEAIPETAPYIVSDANAKADADNHAAKARQALKITRPTKNKVGHKRK